MTSKNLTFWGITLTKDKMIEIGKVDRKTLSVGQVNQPMILFNQQTILIFC